MKNLKRRKIIILKNPLNVDNMQQLTPKEISFQCDGLEIKSILIEPSILNSLITFQIPGFS